MDKVAVRVPASTANLGPGFDCLGMALDVFNEITLSPAPSLTISVQGEGHKQIGRGQSNLTYRAVSSVFNEAGKAVPDLSLVCHNRIPLARGLGSSAAAIAGGLVAANEFLGRPLPPEELLQLGAKLEGHADNIAPALFGGCQIVLSETPHAGQEGARYCSVPLPAPSALRAVLFIPDFAMSTTEARNILPSSIARSDAVFNLGRVALLTLALSAGKLEYLRVATEDRLHQPARQAIFPAMAELFRAALDAGALGAFLSGSGSTVLAFTADESKTAAIGQAMQAAAATSGVNGRLQVAAPTPLGAHVVVSPDGGTL